MIDIVGLLTIAVGAFVLAATAYTALRAAYNQKRKNRAFEREAIEIEAVGHWVEAIGPNYPTEFYATWPSAITGQQQSYSDWAKLSGQQPPENRIQ